MSEALDVLDELTRLRDRANVDATLVAAFLDLLNVESVALWRLQGDSDAERVWDCAAFQRAGEVTPLAGMHWAGSVDAVPAQQMPDHLRCVSQGVIVTATAAASNATLTLLPVGGGQVDCVIELSSLSPPLPETIRLAMAVLKIYRNFQTLLDYSERDTLTGLLNRKGFDDTFLRATVAEARIEFSPSPAPERRTASEQRYWLGVVDIDHFKSVNDRFGHLIGDEVLVLVARLMRSTFRYLDRLYRFGGEEFVILLVAPDEPSALRAFERFRINFENFAFPQVGRVTVSIGFTNVRAGDTPQAAFERADRAVYYSKDHGRNQVSHYETLVSVGNIVDDVSEGDVELF